MGQSPGVSVLGAQRQRDGEQRVEELRGKVRRGKRMQKGDTKRSTSLIVSYFFAFLLFWAPLCLVVGAKKYFFGALYKNNDE